MYLMGDVDRYIAPVSRRSRVGTLIFFRLLLSNCLNWKIYRHDHSSHIARYIGRYSTECQSIFDRVQVDISVEYRPMYRPILLSVDILDDSPILDWYLIDTWPMLHRYVTSVDTRPTRDRYRSIYALDGDKMLPMRFIKSIQIFVNWS